MNLGLQVDFYAARSKKIAELKAVLDLLARFWDAMIWAFETLKSPTSRYSQPRFAWSFSRSPSIRTPPAGWLSSDVRRTRRCSPFSNVPSEKHFVDRPPVGLVWLTSSGSWHSLVEAGSEAADFSESESPCYGASNHFHRACSTLRETWTSKENSSNQSLQQPRFAWSFSRSPQFSVALRGWLSSDVGQTQKCSSHLSPSAWS